MVVFIGWLVDLLFLISLSIDIQIINILKQAPSLFLTSGISACSNPVGRYFVTITPTINAILSQIRPGSWRNILFER